jgi:phenylacetate-CoA ligase
MPSVNQYHPLHAFLQVEAGEILLTMRGAVPLVRYNTHDRGGILTLQEVLMRCRDAGYDLPDELRARGFGPEALRPLPFLYTYGRSDAVTVHGANVFTDEVAHVLAQPELAASTTGNFRLAAATEPDGRAALQVEVELRPAVEATEALREQYQRGILEGLQRTNSEFRNAYHTGQRHLRVEVAFVPFGGFAQTGVKHQFLVR